MVYAGRRYTAWHLWCGWVFAPGVSYFSGVAGVTMCMRWSTRDQHRQQVPHLSTQSIDGGHNKVFCRYRLLMDAQILVPRGRVERFDNARRVARRPTRLGGQRKTQQTYTWLSARWLTTELGAWFTYAEP